MRRRDLALALAFTSTSTFTSMTGCGHEGPDPGVRDACETGGATLGCAETPIETIEDACWRLVECGAIPVANPASEPECCFDWADCVQELDEMESSHVELALACVEAAPCSELLLPGSPDRPTRDDAELPACLQHASH
jgi:hypothetical protein